MSKGWFSDVCCQQLKECAQCCIQLGGTPLQTSYATTLTAIAMLIAQVTGGCPPGGRSSAAAAVCLRANVGWLLGEWLRRLAIDLDAAPHLYGCIWLHSNNSRRSWYCQLQTARNWQGVPGMTAPSSIKCPLAAHNRVWPAAVDLPAASAPACRTLRRPAD